MVPPIQLDYENPDRSAHWLRGDTNDSYVIRDQMSTSNRVVINTSGQVGIASENPRKTMDAVLLPYERE